MTCFPQNEILSLAAFLRMEEERMSLNRRKIED